MSNSPINFLGMLGAASSLMGGRSAKKNAGKIRKRVSKLENQVGAMIRKTKSGTYSGRTTYRDTTRTSTRCCSSSI